MERILELSAGNRRIEKYLMNIGFPGRFLSPDGGESGKVPACR